MTKENDLPRRVLRQDGEVGVLGADTALGLRFSDLHQVDFRPHRVGLGVVGAL